MTDIHTHILPGMDDGASNARESIEMLLMEANQGVDTVVLTPHFYPNRESVESFLRRREESARCLAQAIAELPEAQRRRIPRLILGAEVAWRADMQEWPELKRLCIGSSGNILVELPFAPWNAFVLDRLCEFESCTGFMPIIAHLERYLKLQKKDMVERLLALGLPIQVGCDALNGIFGVSASMKLLKCGRAHILASDCHNCGDRKPNLGQGMDIVRKKLGPAAAGELARFADELAGN